MRRSQPLSTSSTLAAMRVIAILWVVAVGCAKPGHVECDDGRTCPEGTVCEPTRALCIAPAQTTVCGAENIADGYPCTANGVIGICDHQVCLPGCGDGITNGDEECDDANFASNDGCSSRCVVEVPSWRPVPDAWRPVTRHGAATITSNDRLVIAGGNTIGGLRTEHTHRLAFGTSAGLGWVPPTASTLPPREAPAMAYDPSRNIIVLFGGINGDALLADTWIYTIANGWVQASPSTSPPARYHAAMAYDPTTQKLVLFGGTKSTDSFQDTWTFDGTSWAPVTTNTPPTRRYMHAMATDFNRNVIVMYAGIVPFNGPYGRDTWEYASGTWTLVDAASAPGFRYGSAMAFTTPNSPSTGTIILYGGVTDANQATSDTWRYDASGWTLLPTPVSPPGRLLATLSPQADGVVLVGGQAGVLAEPLRDVWRFTNGAWTDVSPRFQPAPRNSTPLAYDEDAREMNLVSGYDGTFLDDAWAYTGFAWFSNAQLPDRPNRFAHVMAYDYARKHTIVFGGHQPLTPVMSDSTFRFVSDGQGTRSWTVLDPPTKPPARGYGAFAFDGNVLVLFGGNPTGAVGFTALSDTWEFDGTTWTRGGDGPLPSVAASATWDLKNARLVLLDAAGNTWTYADHAWTQIAHTGPPPREHAAMTYDYLTKRVLLVGGRTSDTREPLADVWELEGDTWREVYVPGPGPLPRTHLGLASHKWARETLLVGGSSSADNVWEFKYSSPTPDEVCTSDGPDNDGDLHDDNNDPDCQERN